MTRSSTEGRRGFLARTLALAGAFTLRPSLARASALATPRHPSDWDLSWLETLQGKHRQVFDLGGIDDPPGPLHVVHNYLDAVKNVYGLQGPDVNAVVGIAGKAFPINVSDAMWAKYGLGEEWKVKDSTTGTWATRNVFNIAATGATQSPIAELLARGAIFWQCNNALGGVAHELADRTKQPFDTVRTELVANLLPHVKLVPAHTLLIGLAQDHGCRYEKLD